MLPFVFRFITPRHFTINSLLYISHVLYKQLISSLFEDLSNYLEMYHMYISELFIWQNLYLWSARRLECRLQYGCLDTELHTKRQTSVLSNLRRNKVKLLRYRARSLIEIYLLVSLNKCVGKLTKFKVARFEFVTAV